MQIGGDVSYLGLLSLILHNVYSRGEDAHNPEEFQMYGLPKPNYVNVSVVHGYIVTNDVIEKPLVCKGPVISYTYLAYDGCTEANNS